jgi:putative intracellular protease/amidase
MSATRIAGFRLGIYVFKDAEIIDFAAPYGVFSVARRFDPELDAFLIADAMRPVQAQAGFTVLPNYSFSDAPAMDAFLIPGGFGKLLCFFDERVEAIYVNDQRQAVPITPWSDA